MRRSGFAATLLAALLSLALAGQVLGVTWSPAVKVAGDPTDRLTDDRSLATASGVTHLVYYEWVDGDLHYRRSTDLGATWGPDTRIALGTDTTEVEEAAVAAYGDTVVAVYRTRSTTGTTAVYVRRSVDKGVHWMARVTLTSYASTLFPDAPSVAIASSGIHVVWTDNRNGKVYYRRSIDGGSTYLPRVEIGTTTRASLNAWPSVAAAGSRVYVAWTPAGSTTCGGASKLVIRRSTDGGATFRAEQTVDSRAHDGIAALSASGSMLLATYSLCDPYRVAVARSGDSGATFTRKVLATATADATPFAGDIFVSGTAARVVFVSYEAATSRLRVQTSADAGVTWSAASTAVTRANLDGAQVVGTATRVLVVYQSWNASGASAGVFSRKATVP